MLRPTETGRMISLFWPWNKHLTYAPNAHLFKNEMNYHCVLWILKSSSTHFSTSRYHLSSPGHNLSPDQCNSLWTLLPASRIIISRRSSIYLVGIPGEDGENRGELNNNLVKVSQNSWETQILRFRKNKVMSSINKNKFRSGLTIVNLQNGKDQEKFLQNNTTLLFKCPTS